MSLKEAARLAGRQDDGAVFVDNALEWLVRSGQKSVAVDKLVVLSSRSAVAAARLAGESDGRISAADQAALPPEFREDVLVLQGRHDAGASAQSVYPMLTALTRDMVHWSESDSPVLAFDAGAPAGPDVTASLVAERVEALYEQHQDALVGGRRTVDTAPLREQPVTQVSDAAGFLTRRARIDDVGNRDAEVYAARWRALGEYARAHLTDLKLFRFGTVEATYVLLGKTADGTLAGFMTGAVET